MSDVEVINQFRKHPTEKTTYGEPKIDSATIPDFVMQKVTNKVTGEKDKIYYHDSAMISILIGAIRELSGRLEILESRVL